MSGKKSKVEFHPVFHSVVAKSLVDAYPNLYQRIQQLSKKPIDGATIVDDLFDFNEPKEGHDFWNLVSMGEFKELKHEFPEFFGDDYIFTPDYPMHFTSHQLHEKIAQYVCVSCFILCPPPPLKPLMDGFQITLEHSRGEKFRIKSTHPKFNMVLNFSDEYEALRQFNSRLNQHIETGGTILEMGKFNESD